MPCTRRGGGLQFIGNKGTTSCVLQSEPLVTGSTLSHLQTAMEGPASLLVRCPPPAKGKNVHSKWLQVQDV